MKVDVDVAGAADAWRRVWEVRERWRLRVLAEPGRVHRQYRARQVARRRRGR